MLNIILCGGSGTRLWPVSRALMPKQFVKLFDNKSLFQLTFKRNATFCDDFMVVTNTDHYFMSIDQISEIEPSKLSSSRFLLESVGRNTAPAVALACFGVNKDEIVFVTPSDHLIKNTENYYSSAEKALKLAEENFLVTFGISPSYPETGYGYIEHESENVLHFREKPDIQTATKYLESGNFLWNSGMFCFKAGVFLEELKKYSPEIYESSETAYENKTNFAENQVKIDLEFMQKIPENSIDYAVMEKSGMVKVIKSDLGWSDLGSFDSFFEEMPKDGNQNHILVNHNMSFGNNIGEPITIGAHSNLLITDKQTALIDVEDLLIIDSPDALLVSKKGSSQKVKDVVNILKKSGSELVDVHRIAHRPWGTYEVLLESKNYKIKRIIVKPGSRLSLQKHFHRSEHWIVVSGTATVTVSEKNFIVRPNESTYIKMGELHRLENQGKIDLVIVEVQVGEYTGEDDIVRIQDDFKRI